MLIGSWVNPTQSCPSRGTWIEIFPGLQIALHALGRAPRGARGLKSGHGRKVKIRASRAPRGARGLKFNELKAEEEDTGCRAPRGARGLKFSTPAFLNFE